MKRKKKLSGPITNDREQLAEGHWKICYFDDSDNISNSQYKEIGIKNGNSSTRKLSNLADPRIKAIKFVGLMNKKREKKNSPILYRNES